MFTRNLKFKGKLLAAILIATGWIGPSCFGVAPAWAAGACQLIPKEKDPSLKTLRCGQLLTVEPAYGTRYRPITKAGHQLPTGVRLDDGAILIEFHPSAEQTDFQILTPLAIAAVRGTKWAMEVSAEKTSTLVQEGAVMVTNRRLNQSVVLTGGYGVDITASDTSMEAHQWSLTKALRLLSRFGD